MNRIHSNTNIFVNFYQDDRDKGHTFSEDFAEALKKIPEYHRVIFEEIVRIWLWKLIDLDKIQPENRVDSFLREMKPVMCRGAEIEQEKFDDAMRKLASNHDTGMNMDDIIP